MVFVDPDLLQDDGVVELDQLRPQRFHVADGIVGDGRLRGGDLLSWLGDLRGQLFNAGVLGGEFLTQLSNLTPVGRVRHVDIGCIGWRSLLSVSSGTDSLCSSLRSGGAGGGAGVCGPKHPTDRRRRPTGIRCPPGRGLPARWGNWPTRRVLNVYPSIVGLLSTVWRYLPPVGEAMGTRAWGSSTRRPQELQRLNWADVTVQSAERPLATAAAAIGVTCSTPARPDRSRAPSGQADAGDRAPITVGLKDLMQRAQNHVRTSPA